ncbi:MAG: hypothetical protein RI911_75, partial [Candidatus Parcubacteria bacterium]
IKLQIDCSKLKTAKAIHASIAEQLNFPEYYGANLDALVDCYGDVLLEYEVSLVWKDTKASLRSKVCSEIKKILQEKS